MAGDKRLSARFGADTTDFKTGISAINRDIRVLESGFRASAASLGDWTKSANGLEQRAKSLTDQIALQKEKVAALTVEYERQVEAEGENSVAAQNALIELNKQTEALGKMESELGSTESALAEMQSGSEDASESVADLGEKSETTGGLLAGMGGIASGLGTALKAGITAVLSLAAAVAGLSAGIGKLVLDAAAGAGELVDLSIKTGISTTRLQELDYVAKQVGTTTETITGAMARLTRGMGAAVEQTGDFNDKSNEAFRKLENVRKELSGLTEGTDEYNKKLEELKAAGRAYGDINMGPQAAAFDQLGVSVTDVDGNLRDSEAVFSDAITALGNMTNETERDVIAMDLFGKSAQELNPLIKAGSEEIARLSEEANTMGAVIGEDDVDSLETFGDTLESLKSGMQGTAGTIAAALVPGFQSLADEAGGYMQQFAEVVKGSDGDIGKMAEGIGGVIGDIVGSLAKQAPQMLQAGLGILQGIITSVIGLLPTLLPMVIELVLTIVNFIVANLPMLIDAAVQIIVALALGIAQALPTLIPTILGIIPTVIYALLENLPLLVGAALQIIVALAAGLIEAIPTLISEIPKIIVALGTALQESAPLLLAAGKQMLVDILSAIAVSMPALQQGAIDLITQFSSGIALAAGAISDMGKAIVDGLWEGIKTQWETLTTNVSSLFTGLVDWIKGLLGIASPSTVFAGIGQNMAMGLGSGFSKAFDGIEQRIAGAVQDLGAAIGGGATLAGAGAMGPGSIQINLGGINIPITGNGDAAAIGAAARRGAKQGLVDAMRAHGMI